jgi:hypothetical protein
LPIRAETKEATELTAAERRSISGWTAKDWSRRRSSASMLMRLSPTQGAQTPPHKWRVTIKCLFEQGLGTFKRAGHFSRCSFASKLRAFTFGANSCKASFMGATIVHGDDPIVVSAARSTFFRHFGTADLGVLCLQPCENVAALSSGRSRPAKVFQGSALLTGPPIFLDHHQRPAMATGTRQRENLNNEPMSWPSKAVSFALEFDAIVRPMGAFQAWIRDAHQEVKEPEEGRLPKILHGAPSIMVRAIQVDQAGAGSGAQIVFLPADGFGRSHQP